MNIQFCLDCGKPLGKDLKCPNCGKIYSQGQIEGMQIFPNTFAETSPSKIQNTVNNPRSGNNGTGSQESASFDQAAWDAWMEQNMHYGNGKVANGGHKPNTDPFSGKVPVQGSTPISNPTAKKKISVYTLVSIVLAVIIVIQLIILIVIYKNKSIRSSAAVPVYFSAEANLLADGDGAMWILESENNY